MLELFQFTNALSPTNLIGAKPVSGWDSAMWVERYQEAGEFEIEAKMSSGLMDQLTAGTFLSHLRTLEVMVVEDHYISEEADEDPTVKITGRSFETILENRNVGLNADWSSGYRVISEYGLPADFSWNQAVKLINDHIRAGITTNIPDEFPNVVAATSVTGSGESVYRPIDRGNLYSRLIDVLKIDNLGLRVIRKHEFSSNFPGNSTDTKLLVHKGNDMSSTVRFSSDTGEIDKAEYFWSIRKHKNAALVVGRNLEVLVEGDSPAASQAQRRVVYVDAGDLDKDYEAGMPQASIDAIVANMQTRGRQALASQNDIGLISVDVSREGGYRYRTDYDIGDLVTVDGTFGQDAIMRVIEHAEIEDEGSYVAYPTLSKY